MYASLCRRFGNTRVVSEQAKGSSMLTPILPKSRLAALLAALAVVGTIAAYAAPAASAQGRTLVGEFGFGNASANCRDTTHFSINLTENGQPVSSLRPGTYWLTVTDNCANHNFELRTCPESMSTCDQNSGGTEQPITGEPAETPGTVTVKVHLVHGTYRLSCDAIVAATGLTHEVAFSMYADFEVGGVGQVG